MRTFDKTMTPGKLALKIYQKLEQIGRLYLLSETFEEKVPVTKIILYLSSVDGISAEIDEDLSAVAIANEKRMSFTLNLFQDIQALLGFQTLPNGLVLLGGNMDSVDEAAFFFFIYWDGLKLRAYIPRDGNLWNTEANMAYGSDEDSDNENCMERFGNDDWTDARFDTDKILAEILREFEPGETTLQPALQSFIPTPSPTELTAAATGSRPFVLINVEQLKEKIKQLLEDNVKKSAYEDEDEYGYEETDADPDVLFIKRHIYDLVDVTDQIQTDLFVSFDLENYEFTDDGYDQDMGLLMGFKTLPNGLSIYGGHAGGDWENSVYMFFYWDGTQIRAFIPDEGNVWNHMTNEAFGNSDSDEEDCRKRYGHEEWNALGFDPEKMLAEIIREFYPIKSPI